MVVCRQLVQGNRFAKRKEGKFDRTSQDRRMYGDKQAHFHLAMITVKVIENASFKHLLTIQTHSVTRNMETRGWTLNDAGFLILGCLRNIAMIKTKNSLGREGISEKNDLPRVYLAAIR